jgi:polysaccharide biosynthesis/export protein
MRHNHFRAMLLVASLIVFCAIKAASQTDLQQKIISAGALNSSRPKADMATAMRPGGLAAIPEDFAGLKLAPGFLLSVNVLSDPDFDGAYRVDQRGEIAIPILGSLHVAGATASEARAQIAAKLSSGEILKDPQVNLQILEYAVPEVTISGEVATPGKYPLLAPHALSDVLALAGGTTLLAASDVDVARSSPETSVVAHYARGGDPARNNDVVVYPGDSINVRRAGVAYVLGAVTRPGGYVMQEQGSLNVLQAVSLANGTTYVASLGNVFVLRRNPDGSEARLAIPYNKIAEGKAANFQLRASDVLYIPTNGTKAFLQNTQSIVAAAASASIYAGIIY